MCCLRAVRCALILFLSLGAVGLADAWTLPVVNGGTNLVLLVRNSAGDLLVQPGTQSQWWAADGDLTWWVYGGSSNSWTWQHGHSYVVYAGANSCVVEDLHPGSFGWFWLGFSSIGFILAVSLQRGLLRGGIGD